MVFQVEMARLRISRRPEVMNAPTQYVARDAELDKDQLYAAALDWLVERKRVREVAREALEQGMARTGEPAILVMNRLGALDDEDLREAICALSGLSPSASLRDHQVIEDPALHVLSERFMKANRAVVLGLADDEVRLGLVDPWNATAVKGVAFALKRRVVVEVLLAREERRMRTSELREEEVSDASAEASENTIKQALDFERDSPVARRVSRWLSDAVEMRASDLHIEPRSNSVEVRFRVDGRLELIAQESVDLASGILARIKVLADLDLGERRKAQDGRATIIVSGRKVDVRVSIVPSVHGEAAVLRILDRGEIALDFASLGFASEELALLETSLSAPHGLLLVTGPTGSGKTTTLYAGLNALEGSGKKILTVEDPVEFHFDHVTQVQVAPKAGVTFASSIRSFLRQDPDIIFVGEIRDAETAKTAVEAALTGHLVLATLHAIDCEKAVPRLIDMGVDPAQLSACLRAVLSQRLVRKLCQRCAIRRPASRDEAALLGAGGSFELVEAGDGCPSCEGSGYRGRIAIGESIALTAELAMAIKETSGATQGVLVPARSMTQDGLAKVTDGVTTLDEVEGALADTE